MRKTLLILAALLVSMNFSLSYASESPVIFTMPELGGTDGATDGSQPGWRPGADLLEKFAEAKYLVIETKGGTRTDGFDELIFAWQGESRSGGTFTYWAMNTIFEGVTFPRAAEKTVSIAIDLESAMSSEPENNLSAFVGWDSWAGLFMCHWANDDDDYEYAHKLHPEEGFPIYLFVDNFGYQNAYLTSDFEKPTDAVDFAHGFVFEGSVAGEIEEPQPTFDFILDFEADELGKEYPTIGWSPEDLSAIVENRPGGEGQALHVIHNNWDAYPVFPSVTFPEGITLADIEKITFELYFESIEEVGDQTPNSWKNFNYFFGAPGTAFVGNKPTGGANHLIGNAADHPAQTWLTKELVPTIGEDLLSLNEFDFGFGMGVNEAGNYFLDNITFVLKGVGIVTVKPFASRVYGTEGGVVVNAINEKVSIYNFDGRLVKQVNANESMIPVTKGLYIVKVGTDKAMKVLVK